jgi:hypothetical protein
MKEERKLIIAQILIHPPPPPGLSISQHMCPDF